jgi:predicted acylesterase/phospholipase RssA
MILIKHLVLSGSGPNIFQSYGTLKHANYNNIWKKPNLKSIHATSGGAMLGLMLLLDISWEDLDDYLINRPWDKLLYISPKLFLNLVNEMGLFKQNSINEIFKPLYESKKLSQDLTMKELYDLTGINFVVYSTSFKKFEFIKFSHIDTPDFKVLDAVYTSSALPPFMCPFKFKDDLYFDGGLFANYPVKHCLEDICEEEKDNVLGICCDSSTKDEQHNTKKATNAVTFLIEIIKGTINHLNELNNVLPKYNIIVASKELSMDFWNEMTSSSECRKNAIDAGQKNVETFMNELGLF